MLRNMIDSREQQLVELKGFTDAVNKEVADIVDILGWTMESVTNTDKEYFTCPYDNSHHVTENCLHDHLVSCQWKAEGYTKSAVPFPESTVPADSPFSIKFDVQLQNEVLKKTKEQNPTMQIGTGERLIPHTSDRLLTDYTRDERRALYDYVIANTAKPDIGQDIADINNLKPQEKEDKEMSVLEMLMHERNLKRRRAKHRGVHTNKKSHVEILREVINQQMEIYTEYIAEKTNFKHTIDDQSIKTDDSNDEIVQYKEEHLYKKFHATTQDYDNFNSKEKTDHYSKDNDLRRKHFERKNDHRLKSRDSKERHSNMGEHNEANEKYKHREHRKSSHSRDRKSHRKDKYRNKDRHREKEHKSHDREKSSERRHTKHSNHKQKEKEY